MFASASAVRVLIVDDQAVFRDAARAVVDATAGFAFVGEATSGMSALEAVESHSAELVLMDVRMPGMGGIEAARIIEERFPRAVVLLLSAVVPAQLADGDGRPRAIFDKRSLCPDLLRNAWARARADSDPELRFAGS